MIKEETVDLANYFKEVRINKIKNRIKNNNEKIISISTNGKIKNIHYKTSDGYMYSTDVVTYISGRNGYMVGKSNPYSIYNMRLFIKNNYIEISKEIDCKYNGNKTIFTFKCSRCGREFNRNFGTIRALKTDLLICRYCTNKEITSKNILSDEAIINKIEEKYTIVRKPSNISPTSKFTVKDDNGFLGLVIYQSIDINNNFFPVSVCNPFSIENIKLFLDRNSTSKLLSDKYTASHQKLKLKCGCGEIYYKTWNQIKDFPKCQKCSLEEKACNARHSYEYIKTWINKNTDAKLLSEKYLGDREKLTLMCSCGNIFEVSWGKIRTDNQYRCSICSGSKSRLEYFTSKFLDELGIKYETQYSIKNPFKDRDLRFDFYLPEFNRIIESDGEGHYKFIKLWHRDEDGFKRRRMYDEYKTNWCKDNNIPLLRIPYWEFKNDNYKQIIKDFIDKNIEKKSGD